MQKLLARATYANVVATLALFIAVGGASAFAATELAPNSVGTRQLKPNAVTSPKVANGSLLSSDFKAGELPAGPRGERGPKGDVGPRGPQGEPGSPGISGYVVVENASAFDSENTKIMTVACPQGTKVIGGGTMLNGAEGLALRISRPDPQGSGWTGFGFETTPNANTWQIAVRAICAKVTP